MKVWIDAQLSPAIARWLQETHGVDARALRDLGLRDSERELADVPGLLVVGLVGRQNSRHRRVDHSLREPLKA